MELEFDKEIDAILRKARPSRGVLVGDDPVEPKKHLDADTISAFAENALPDKAKLLYIEHFADCDRCRNQLSFVMQMSSEADAAAASSVSAVAKETAIPWFQSIFRTPNLALAMGALVLAFSGVLGYLVLQKQNNDASNVSQVTEPEQTRGGPYFNGESVASNAVPANVAPPANTTAPASNAAANSAAILPGRGPNAEPDTVGRLDSAETRAATAKENNYQLDGVSGGAAPAAKSAAAPPSPVTTDTTSSGIATERDEKKLDDGRLKKESKDLELAKRKHAEDRASRDLPRAASNVGPSRSGPLQNKSNQVNSNVFDMSVTRIVAGKTFNNRNGAWYDSAYRGQSTTNVRRGTDEFKKLDSGLRNIANTLGGTVVVVWKAKAYRIQ